MPSGVIPVSVLDASLRCGRYAQTRFTLEVSLRCGPVQLNTRYAVACDVAATNWLGDATHDADSVKQVFWTTRPQLGSPCTTHPVRPPNRRGWDLAEPIQS